MIYCCCLSLPKSLSRGLHTWLLFVLSRSRILSKLLLWSCGSVGGWNGACAPPKPPWPHPSIATNQEQWHNIWNIYQPPSSTKPMLSMVDSWYSHMIGPKFTWFLINLSSKLAVCAPFHVHTHHATSYRLQTSLLSASSSPHRCHFLRVFYTHGDIR